MTAVSSQPVRGSRFPTLEKYDVLEELGHGGMATVYRARDLRLGRDVAIKVIHPHLRDSAEAIRRFSIEARAVAKLRHTNIVEVYDVSAPTEPEQYLVVELLRGVTLRRLLETHGALPAEVAASIAIELLAALAHAHDEGVIHRDVKPENVIIEHRSPTTGGKSQAPMPTAKDDSSPGSPVPPQATPLPSGSFAMVTPSRPSSDTPGDRITIKLTDFGIAKLLDAQGVTSTGQVLGSPAHMAPEQIEGREVDGRADVFAIGVLLYECMVGHLPFMGQNPAQVLRRVLEGEYASAEHEKATVGRCWSRILDHALAGAVEDRFADAAQMRDALMRELARLGITSPRGEVEAWLDDPAAFTVAHQAAMTSRLCAKGDEASDRRDALGAAADYNRALAYAPHDAALMKLVSRVNRRNARRTVVRRAAPYVAVALLLAAAGVGVKVSLTRAARVRALAQETPMTPLPVTNAAPDALAVPAVVGTVTVPEPVTSARIAAHPVVATRPKNSTREVQLTSLEPENSVQVAMDGRPPIPLDAARTITLPDDLRHTLTFSCKGDLCEAQTRRIEAGDRTVPLSIQLTIKPGRLVIRGVPGNHYSLTDDPNRELVSVRDFPNAIPMKKGEARRTVEVREIETGKKLSVTVKAGDSAPPLDFANPP